MGGPEFRTQASNLTYSAIGRAFGKPSWSIYFHWHRRGIRPAPRSCFEIGIDALGARGDIDFIRALISCESELGRLPVRGGNQALGHQQEGRED